MKKFYKKFISIDLDGVLNEYHGNYSEQNLSPLKNGAYEVLEALSQLYEVEIYTARDSVIVEKWIEENNLTQFIKKVTDQKNPCTSVFVDDRAITFFGDFKKIMHQILNFKPYWKD